MGILGSLFKPNIQKLKEKKDIKGLVNALGNKDTSIRKGAVMVLGEIGTTEAIEPLINCLKDAESSVREKVAWALGQIEDGRTIDPLTDALRDKDANVREKAAQSLEKIKKTEDQKAEERRKAEEKKKIDNQNKIKSLIRTFYDGHTIKAIDACNELLKFGSAAHQPLIDGLSDSSSNMRSECAWVLGRLAMDRLGDPRAIPHLSKLVNDPYYGVRQMVAWALGKIGKPECVSPLLILLEDNIGSEEEKRIVREHAANALEEIEKALPPFNQKYGGYKATWSGNSFDEFDFKALLIELPIVSKGTLFNLQNSYGRNFSGDVDFIYTKIKDILREDVQKAKALNLISCFIRPTKNSWEFNVHYVSRGIEMITPYEVVKSREDNFCFYAGVIKL